MDYFYIIVFSLTLIMLIILLIIFGSMLYTKKEDYSFPIHPNNCPDNWPEINGSCMYFPKGLEDEVKKWKDEQPKIYMENYDRIKKMLDRVKNVGNNNGTLQSLEDIARSKTALDSKNDIWEFNSETLGFEFNDNATICQKKKWANFHGIRWDGVTNYNNCD